MNEARQIFLDILLILSIPAIMIFMIWLAGRVRKISHDEKIKYLAGLIILADCTIDNYKMIKECFAELKELGVTDQKQYNRLFGMFVFRYSLNRDGLTDEQRAELKEIEVEINKKIT